MAVTKAVAMNYLFDGNKVSASVAFIDTSNDSINDVAEIELSGPTITDAIAAKNAVVSGISTYASNQGYTLSDGVIWVFGVSDPTNYSFANPARSLNSAFQISSSRSAFVSYTVDIAATLTLVTGQTGTVTLQYADDSGFTTNVKTAQSNVNGNAGTLAIGLGLTQTTSATLNAIIPAGKYVKIVTANTVGTPTFTFRSSQEVLL